ncbi:MAG: phosphoesterase [Saprospiraceae bacterium]|uniref:Phosphoesterase n=1 Tax=Candidatus Opimibacter skivensis TaxID=2982028 RepID=A0A9D7XTQ2_9BACT|nr:phosphoesterase [Candidatus Opimibacter skivensis]
MDEKTLTLQWNQLTLDAIKYTKSSPPVATRALAMVHTAMYDAWSVYDKVAISTTTALYIKAKKDQCSKENVRKSFSYAAYRVLTELFWLKLPPENKNLFKDLMCKCSYDPDDTTFNIQTPQGIGNLAARMTIEYRNGDGSNSQGTLHASQWSDYTGYQPVNTPEKVNDLNQWQPLLIDASHGDHHVQNFLVAHWGLVRPFSLSCNWQFRPDPPLQKEQPGFKEQAQEVIDASAGLTDQQKVIAEYWTDGSGTFTSAGHWCEIAQFVSMKNNYRNSQCIKLFFALCNALLDASIACWECKHFYNSVRPVTAIRELCWGLDIQAWAGPGLGTRTIKGEKWNPYIPTPPFPEHVSFISTCSYAGATILKQFTGSDVFGGCTIIDKGSSTIEPVITPSMEITLDWLTYTFAAEQAGKSRLYGGVHFNRSIEFSQKLGQSVGISAWEKASFYFNI